MALIRKKDTLLGLQLGAAIVDHLSANYSDDVVDRIVFSDRFGNVLAESINSLEKRIDTMVREVKLEWAS